MAGPHQPFGLPHFVWPYTGSDESPNDLPGDAPPSCEEPTDSGLESTAVKRRARAQFPPRLLLTKSLIFEIFRFKAES